MSFYFGSNNVPSVRLVLPSRDLLRFPPASEPQTLHPPTSDFSLARPFNIDPDLYNNALNFAVPITIAAAYAVVVTFVNIINKRRDNKPWAFSNSVIFYLLVLLHNVFLAAFSAWTCLGMLNAFVNTWPGWPAEHGLAEAVDSLCKTHGPRGFGSAATFNPANTGWGFTDTIMKLEEELPDSTDVGRLWNEGLAFYGWLFYISKFYEVIDTMIILSKGKTSAFFQTFHHAGAMMCMWAGIRYMSPPIWMFVFINSGIHALMYTYYTLHHLMSPLPSVLKRAITTLQIVQFVFGASYAMAHLFIAYDIPVQTPYSVISGVSSAIPTVTSSLVSELSSATVTAGAMSWLKKAALRAAGEEGLAENVRNSAGESFGIDAVHASEAERMLEEVKYKLEYQQIDCLDTSGEAFAILLNFLYLAPLTFMFLKFFVRSYLSSARNSSPSSPTENFQKSSKEASWDIKMEIQEAMDSEQSNLETDPSDIPHDIKSFVDSAKESGAAMSEKMKETANHANHVLQDRIQAGTDIASEKVNELNRKAKESRDETSKPEIPESATSNAKTSDEPPKNENSREASPSPSSTKPASSNEKNPVFKRPDLPKPKRSQSRSQSPRKSELPRPKKPESRTASPEKNSEAAKAAEKQQKPNGTSPESSKEEEEAQEDEAKEEAGEKKSSLEESAYEVNPDELKSEEEKKVEEEQGGKGAQQP